VEDGSEWIHPKLTAGSLAAGFSLRKGSENPREIADAAGGGVRALPRGAERARKALAERDQGLTR